MMAAPGIPQLVQLYATYAAQLNPPRHKELAFGKDDMNLDHMLVFEGISRSVLVERIRELVSRLKVGCLTCRGGQDYKLMLDNLTSTQARCTELLTEVRAYRASGICLPGWRCGYCQAFNGSAREVLERCRACDAPR